MNVRNELLTRARNLERYPFESATMAEAGRLAAKHLREVAAEMCAEKSAASGMETRRAETGNTDSVAKP